MKKYVIGIDFGTLSGRALLVDAESGEELGQAVREYAHGVMETSLPSGKKLPKQFALQDPADYLEVLGANVREVIEKSGIDPRDVAGIGIDFTTCTVLPVFGDGTPLCFLSEYKDEPHAYVKLWKHHAAQKQADEINLKAKERGEKWLSIYGGKISSEWLFPKVLEIVRNAPEIYEKTERFVEAGDWMTWMLTGKECHSAAFAGYKGLWNSEDGYPSNDFFEALDPRMKNIIGTKICDKVAPAGSIAGVINERGAELTGLEIGTAVAVSKPDAHVALPALGITGDNELMIIMGTSGCHIINSKRKITVPGICGYVKDDIVPGYYTYEAGQACVGDCFDRFVKNYVPQKYTDEAKESGIGIHALLRKKAQKLGVGESGLLVLDWFNGNRSVLNDSDLSGVIVGLKLTTTPEEIYRALIEGTAFGTRMIIDNYESNGIRTDNIYASGGIARKDEMMMQIYADVTNREIRVSGTDQAAALGSAMYASVAAGIYPTIEAAAERISRKPEKVYTPDRDNHEKYNKLFEEYKILHDYFGRGANDVMKRL